MAGYELPTGQVQLAHMEQLYVTSAWVLCMSRCIWHMDCHQHLSSNKMALITSDCVIIRSSNKMALITSDCGETSLVTSGPGRRRPAGAAPQGRRRHG